MANISKAFTDSQLADIISQKMQGKTYSQIAAALDKTYGIQVSPYSVQRAYLKYQHMFDVSDSRSALKQLQEVARVKRSNSQTARQNKKILDALNEQQDVMEQIQLAVDSLKNLKVPVLKAPGKVKDKPSMTVEVMVSDVHIGKLTETFNVEVCRARLKQYTELVMHEIYRKQAHYSVERIALLFLGDEIENATMHGIESMRGCEFANPEQIRYAIDIFLHEVLIPLAQLGIPMDVICVTGNHSREGEKKTYQKPGKNNFSWAIYQTLMLICNRAGLKHLNWIIPEGVFAVYEVYGANILIEHGDNMSGWDKKSILGHLAKRSGQTGKLLKGIRLGHVHEFSCMDNGRIIINGSVCGQDSYSEVLGYSTVPVQVITFYVNTKNRDTPYYYSLPALLNAGAAS